MSIDDTASRGFSLKRWSQRKLAAARAASATPSAPATPAVETTDPAQPAPAPLATTAADVGAQPMAEPALPTIDSLTIDSDFTGFLRPDVDPALRLQALKKLFQDPRFNVMDGLDVYIDDYSIPDPLEPEVARSLAHARYVFDPPPTQVNEAGFVEDIPAEEARGDASGLPPETTTPVAASPVSSATPDADTTPSSDTTPPSDATGASDMTASGALSPLRSPAARAESASRSTADEGELREAPQRKRR